MLILDTHAVPLVDALEITGETRVIALVGGGGKTTLMYALARDLRARGSTVITTTTTRIYPPTSDQCPALLLVKDDPILSGLPSLLELFSHVTVGDALESKTGKLRGIDFSQVYRLREVTTHVLIEADGAAGRPIKAPETWEPVIPGFTDLVIPVVGLDCLGEPVSESVVFRMARFAAVTGLAPGDIIGPHAVAALLGDARGALKEVPLKTRVIPFLNAKGRSVADGAIEEIARLLEGVAGDRVHRLVVGSPLIGSRF